MLKKILENLDGVDEKYHGLYEQKADGKFHLKLENDDADELRRAKEHEKTARQEAERKEREAREQITQLQKDLKAMQDAKDDGHRKDNNVEALDASWQTKYTQREAELNGSIEKLQGALKNQLVDNVAQTMAAKLAGENSEIIMPHIHRRLSVEIGESGEAKTVVLDATGTRSALTVEELEKEFFTSDKFAPIVIASKAKGSGATGADRGGDHKRKFSEMSSAEKVALKRKDPEVYRRLRDADVAKK